MRAEWQQARLGDLVEIFDGPHATPQKATSGPVFLGISSLCGGRLDLAQSEHVSEDDFARWTRRVTPSPDDVVFSYETRLGEVALIPRGLRCCLGRRMGLLRARDGRVDSRFLLYAYLGPEFQATIRQRTVRGSTVDRIPLVEMPNFLIAVPDLPTQRAIAHILGTLDDKIELNRRMNDTLEAMARALFKSWFVDFDPVRAKAEGRQPSGMDAETAKLFPSEFVESELGRIPKGWMVEPLDAIADFRNGLALQKYRPDDGEPRLPVVKIAQLRTGEADSGEWARADIDRSCVLDDGDVVFSWSGSLTVVVWCGGRAALNQHLFRVTSERYPKWFCLQWLLVHLQEFQNIASDKATTMGHIQRHHLTEAKCVVPPDAVLRALARRFDGLLEKQIATDLESRSLRRTRDALLPRLLSGEVSVANAEREVEAVA